MRTSRFSNKQIVQALRQAETGTPVVDICRKMGITETTFYRLEEAVHGARRQRAPRAEAAPRGKPEAQERRRGPHAR